MGYAAKAKQVLAERRGEAGSPSSHREESEISEERVADAAPLPSVAAEISTSPCAESDESEESPEAAVADGDAGAGVDVLVARVLALSRKELAAWRREVIHAAVWAAAGKRDDPHLLADLRALRRVEAAGACLRCSATCPADGRFWCARCQERYADATEDKTT